MLQILVWSSNRYLTSISNESIFSSNSISVWSKIDVTRHHRLIQSARLINNQSWSNNSICVWSNIKSPKSIINNCGDIVLYVCQRAIYCAFRWFPPPPTLPLLTSLHCLSEGPPHLEFLCCRPAKPNPAVFTSFSACWIREVQYSQVGLEVPASRHAVRGSVYKSQVPPPPPNTNRGEN